MCKYGCVRRSNTLERRGVIIFLTKQNKIPIVEYTPSEMKLNIAGSGNADKKT